jgi:hypothetical protein
LMTTSTVLWSYSSVDFLNYLIQTLFLQGSSQAPGGLNQTKLVIGHCMVKSLNTPHAKYVCVCPASVLMHTNNQVDYVCRAVQV